MFLVSLPQQVITEWRDDQQRSIAHTSDANAHLRGAQPQLARQMRTLARAAHGRDAARRGVVVDLQIKLASWAEAILFEVKTLLCTTATGPPHQAQVLARTVRAREDTQQVVR